MATAPVPSHKAFVGIAKETTKGAGLASSAYIPVHRDSLKFTPGRQLLEDKGSRGAPGEVYNHVAGVSWAEIGWGGDVFPDSIGWVIAGLFGEDATTGTGPYTHNFTALNSGTQQPTSYTVDVNYVAANRQIPGLQFSEATFTFSTDALLTYTTKGIGFPSTNPSSPTPSWAAAVPLTGWQCNAQIAASSSSDVLSGEISIKRTVSRVHTANTSSGAPSAVWAGGLMIDGKLTLVMESDTELSRLLTPTSVALDINFQPDANHKVQFAMSKAQYTAAEPNLGKDWVELPITFTADLNVTDVGASGGYSPGRVLVTNGVAPGVYG